MAAFFHVFLLGRQTKTLDLYKNTAKSVVYYEKIAKFAPSNYKG